MPDESPLLELPFAPPPASTAPSGCPRLRIGTSGFSYGDWRGPFYPDRLPDRQMLDYYARHFPAVEINASYYHVPSARSMASLARRAEGRLEFAVKAPRDMTHARESYASTLPFFREAIGPLREAGRLGCLLVQFPFSFQAAPENKDFLRRLRDDLAADPVAIEFRHRSWITEETFGLLGELGLAYCCVDEPDIPTLPPPVARRTAPVAYVRFHGRNRHNWWNAPDRHGRYDYLYSETELREWVPRLRSLAHGADRCFAFFNNHLRGQAITNAQMLAGLVAGEDRVQHSAVRDQPGRPSPKPQAKGRPSMA